MRILWVKVGGFWPLNAGGRIRSFQIVRELSKRHSVSVLTTHARDDEKLDLEARLPHIADLRSFLHSPAKRSSATFARSVARSWLSSLPADLWRWRVPPLQLAAGTALASASFDLCVADFLSAVPNLPSPCRVPVILFEHNVEHLIWKRLSPAVPSWQRPAVEVEWRKLRRFESRACAKATLTLAVSESDRSVLASIAPQATVRAIPTGVDTDYFVPDGREEMDTSLAFVGSMDWYPNEDAALRLIDVILPLIRAEIPSTRLTIVGRDPSQRLRSAASASDVRVTGTVADVRPYIAEAAVLVVPVRIAGGTRLKIFEAMAMGKPVVSTTIGAEGLPVLPGQHFVAADDPGSFAREVVSLLRDPDRRRALGSTGRQLVADHFSWQHAAAAFEGHCLNVVS